MKISLIACVGKNLELGKNNDLIWHLKGDMKFFKETTKGHHILMGRKTFQSLPKLLEDRKHLVLTSPHPSPYSANSGFFGSKPFSKTNEFLIKNNKKPIDWQL